MNFWQKFLSRFDSTHRKIIPTGMRGEMAVADFVRRKGWRLIEQNWKCKIGELDLVCRDGDTLVFVEVKASEKRGQLPPESRVNWRKQRKLIALAKAYRKAHHLMNPVRFDVFGVWWEEENIRIRHIENAFHIHH